MSGGPAGSPVARLLATDAPAAVVLIRLPAVAMLGTKVPILLAEGFRAAAHEARTDWSMFPSRLFPLLVGAGRPSPGARLAGRARRGAGG